MTSLKRMARSFGVFAILLFVLLLPVGLAYGANNQADELTTTDHQPQPALSNPAPETDIKTDSNLAPSAALLTSPIDEKKLIPNDGGSGDRFGREVSHDGDYAIVASYLDDNENGTNAGAAYIYHWNGTDWLQTQKLVANGGAADDYFGYSVALNGDIAVVGATRDDDRTTDAGAAYVYRRNSVSGVWQFEQQLFAGDASTGDFFGSSVAIDGNLILVSATNGDGLATDSGSAYLFRHNGTSWNQEAELNASDGAARDFFGSSVSVSGDAVIVGAPYRDDAATNTGVAYIYRKDGTNWQEEARLIIVDLDVSPANARFGQAVSIKNDLAAVGTNLYGTPDIVYVYRFNNGTWEQEAELRHTSNGTGAFGSSVAIGSNDIILVGDPLYRPLALSRQVGAAHLFQYDGFAWKQEKVLLPSNYAQSWESDFGGSVSLSGDTALVGSSIPYNFGPSGAAYMYDFSNGFGTPDIDVSPPIISIFIDEGEHITETLTIENIGTGDLYWQVSWEANWISSLLSNYSPTFLPGYSSEMSLVLPEPNTSFTDGTYTDTLTFTSNDPNEPSVEVLVEVVVGPGRVESISYNSAAANAGNVPVVIKGRFREPVSASIGGVPLQNVTLDTYSTLHATVPVASLSGVGSYDLVVTSDGDALTLANGFTVTPEVDKAPFLAMVYLACDNNLTNSCRKLFNNLELAMSNNPNLRIAAFWDGDQQGDSAHYLVQPDDNPYRFATYDSSNKMRVGDGEVDSSDPATLVEFTGWAQSQYPGEYNFLSLVDHGGGWAPDFYPAQGRGYDWGGPGQNVGGMFWDDHAGGVMTTRQLAGALDYISQGNSMDLIYLDSCLMATVEVMAELSPYAEYFVASENLAWATYRYDLYFDDVDGDTTPLALAQTIANINRDEWPSTGHPAQIGVIQSNQMDNLLDKLDLLAIELSNNLDATTRRIIQEIVLDTAHIAEDGNWSIDSQDSAIDLRHFAEGLNAHPSLPTSVKDAAQNVMTAFDLVMSNSHTHSSTPWPTDAIQYWDLSDLHGLSLYFPLADEWKRPYYSDNALPRFASQTGWDDFIQLWYEGQIAPQPPTDLCDRCLITPMSVALLLEEPSESEGDVLWVPVKLSGAVESDDIHSVQVKVQISDTDVLVPASDQTPRMGDLFPTDSFTHSVATSSKWDFVLTDFSEQTISGTGVIVELPFYFSTEEGCTEVEFDTHVLYDNVPSQINHFAAGRTLCNTNTGNLTGLVKLERRPPNTHGDSTITANGGTDYQKTSGANGLFNFLSLLKDSYTVRYEHLRFLYYEDTVTIDGVETVPDVTLCAGDMDSNDTINTVDQDILLAGIAPVSFSDYDLNADGNADVGDLFILQANIGKSAPVQCAPASGMAQQASSRTAERIANEQQRIQAHQRSRAEMIDPVPSGQVIATLRAENITNGESFNAIGVRIDLPVNTTIDLEQDIELIGPYAGGFLDKGMEDDELIIIARPPDGQALTQDSDIARIRMSVPQSGDVSIEATNPNELDGRLVLDLEVIPENTFLYLPAVIK